MEESEKRRERLQAMRNEAAQSANSESTGLVSAGLSNPLIECESSSPTPLQYPSQRFDYYTDPMAAFSGTRRRNNITPHQVSQGHHNKPPRHMYEAMTLNPVYQNPGVNSPDQRIFQVPRAHFNQGPLGSPMNVATPLGRPERPVYEAMTLNPVYQNPGVHSPDQRIFQVPGPHFNQSPLGPRNVAAPWGRPEGNPPNAWARSGGAFNYSTPPNLSRGGRSSYSSFAQGDSPYVNYGRGRGQRYGSSSKYESGRGGSWYPDIGSGRSKSLGNRSGPGSGQSGRRGAGSHKSVSAELRPDLYYRKEMVEDPWKLLTPIIWKDVHAKVSDKSWLPKSITMKKAKVSSEASQTSISQQSLAEYLAASFSDSTNEAVNDERGT